MSAPLIQSLLAAVAAAPDDVPLRVLLARLLLDAGDTAAAAEHAAAALERDPSSVEARDLVLRATGEESAPAAEPGTQGFDWQRAEAQVGDIAPPMFVEGDDDDAAPFDVERSTVRLDDVGGMVEVKRRLEAAFLAPMRNPELRKLYGKKMHGGLLLYGPPGCGKTFIARAVAGELGAQFLGVSIHDVLEMWIGSSERNLHGLFDLARRSAPCVLFIDEVDAIGRRRSQLQGAMRTVVNQLLAEMDGQGENDGVYVLGATNHPWDVDPALRRPGRFDRMLLVLPPDAARARRSSATT